MRDWRVVLIHLDGVVVWHVPLQLVDKNLLAQRKELVERTSVAMKVRKVEADIFHESPLYLQNGSPVPPILNCCKLYYSMILTP